MPVKYQGNKNRYASRIEKEIHQTTGKDFYTLPFYEFCCGSAAVSRQLSPNPTTLIDLGPWGKFWNIVSLWGKQVKNEAEEITASMYETWVRRMALRAPPSDPLDWAITFLALQREAFNGKPVSYNKVSWKHPGFGTQFSYTAWTKAVDQALSLNIRAAHKGDVNNFHAKPGIIYMDPDYEGTQGYDGRSVNIEQVLLNNPESYFFVSYDRKLDGPWQQIKDISDGTRTAYTRSAKEYLHIRRPTC